MLWREAPQDQKISVVQNSMNPLLHVDWAHIDCANIDWEYNEIERTVYFLLEKGQK
jgi:hypothetical protein